MLENRMPKELVDTINSDLHGFKKGDAISAELLQKQKGCGRSTALLMYDRLVKRGKIVSAESAGKVK